MERICKMLLLFHVFFLVFGLAEGNYWKNSRLPMFKRVEVNTTNNITLVQLYYTAPERAEVRWFVDGFQVTGYHRDYFLANVYEVFAFVIMSTSVMGRPNRVCLTNTVGETCLDLRPVAPDLLFEVELDFPWPLIVPAPRARYNAGEARTLFLPQLTTPYEYSYSALLYARRVDDPEAPLLKAQSRDMQGGRGGDLVTIAPVTSGSAGWMVRVGTDREDVEGVLMVTTTFTLDSDLVVLRCTTTRPINVYRRSHTAPFPTGFLSQLPRDSPDLPWACRDGENCVITCPYVSDGDVEVSLSRVNNENHLSTVFNTYGPKTHKLGDFIGEAQIELPTYTDEDDRGKYFCNITSKSGGNIAVEVNVRGE